MDEINIFFSMNAVEYRVQESVANTPIINMDSTLLDKLSYISKLYNISYEELCRTFTTASQSQETTAPEKTESVKVVCHEVENKSVGIPTLDRFKYDHLKKTLKELKELAEVNKVGTSGTKERIVERIYAAIYPSGSTRPVSKEKSSVTISSSVEKTNGNETMIKRCIDEKDNGTSEKRDIAVDTSDLDLGLNYIHKLQLKTLSPKKAIVNEERESSGNNIFSKWNEIHDRDIILLLQTHQLPLQGTRRDWIQRLMDYYSSPIQTNTQKKITDDAIKEDESLVSRIEVKPTFMKCISKANPISFHNEKDERTGNIRLKLINFQVSSIQSSKPDKLVRYLWLRDKNWVFREDDSSYEFIGIIQEGYLLYTDIPYELMEMNDTGF